MISTKIHFFISTTIFRMWNVWITCKNMESVGDMLILYQKVRFPLTRKSADLKFLFFFFLKTFFYTFFEPGKRIPLMNSIIFVRLLSDCFKVKRIKDCDSIIYPLLVAEAWLEQTTFGLWAQRATNCSTPRCCVLITGAKVRLFSNLQIISASFSQIK